MLDDYAEVTPLEWAEYEFDTVAYDYKIPEKAAATIRNIMKRLANE